MACHRLPHSPRCRGPTEGAAVAVVPWLVIVLEARLAHKLGALKWPRCQEAKHDLGLLNTEA